MVPAGGRDRLLTARRHPERTDVGAGACYLWQERITFDLVADLALLGLPAVVIGLCLS